MPITTTALFQEVGLRITGSVRWGTPVPSKACGVYVVSLSSDPSRHANLHAQAPIDPRSAQQWISRVPTIQLDEANATAPAIINRLKQFWLDDESILYIGKATPLQSRIRAYYATPPLPPTESPQRNRDVCTRKYGAPSMSAHSYSSRYGLTIRSH